MSRKSYFIDNEPHKKQIQSNIIYLQLKPSSVKIMPNQVLNEKLGV